MTTKISNAETEVFTTSAADKTSFSISNAAGGKTTVNVITVHYVIDSTGGGESGGDEPGGEEPGGDEGIANPYTYTFTAKVFDAKEQSNELEGVNWALKMTCADETGYFGYDGTKGQQFGSGSKPATELTLNTSDIPGTITSVKINTSGASSVVGTVGVTVGETALLCDEHPTASLTSSATVYEFTGSASGDITISYAQTSSKALYIKSIEVTYTTADVPAEFQDFAVIVNNQTGTLLTSEEQVQGTAVEFGVAVDAEGNTYRVAASDAKSIATVSGNYHSDHGMTGMKVVVAVPGAVKILVGQCTYSSNDIKVSDSNGDVVVTATPTTACWKNDPKNVTELIYKGEATTLTITGMGYCPFISVETVDPSQLVTDATVTFAAGEAGSSAFVPEAIKQEVGKKITLPKNFTMYVEGKTLTGWSDGEQEYAVGSEYTVPENDVTLTAVFTTNEVSLADRTEPVTVKFDFLRQNGAPTVGFEGKTGIWVAQAIVNGKTIDVKADFDTTNGKFANGGWTDWAQLNNGTMFTVPSCKDAIVSMEAFNEITTTTIDGQNDYTSANTISYTIAGAAETVGVVIGDGSYYVGSKDNFAVLIDLNVGDCLVFVIHKWTPPYIKSN